MFTEPQCKIARLLTKEQRKELESQWRDGLSYRELSEYVQEHFNCYISHKSIWNHMKYHTQGTTKGKVAKEETFAVTGKYNE